VITNAKALAGLVLLSLAAHPLQAGAQQGAREPVTHRHVISGNPLLLLGGWFNAEYERKLAGNATMGIAAGWLEMDKHDYTTFSGFVRFYPQGGVFTKFYLGGRGGVYRINEARDADGGDTSQTAVGLGIDVGYTWLKGPGRYLYLGLGVGASHLFGDIGNASRTVPNLRLLDVGIAF
jgi:hypothetical protein